MKTFNFQFTLAAAILISIVVIIPAYSSVTGKAFRPELPVVLSPKDISEFRGINDVEFIWSKMPGALKYHVVLAKDRKFKHIVHEATLTGTSYIMSDLDLGTYFFRMNAVAQDEAPGSYSETLSLIIVPPPPARTPVISAD